MLTQQPSATEHQPLLEDIEEILDHVTRRNGSPAAEGIRRLLLRAVSAGDGDVIQASLPVHVYVIQEVLKDRQIPTELLDRFLERLRTHAASRARPVVH